MQLIKFTSGATLELKKDHPCGSRLFSVLRGGSDVRIKCLGCGRDMTLPREKIEKMIKKVHGDTSQVDN